jgi:BirA family biotin operon repressor/biotin-[acetyl-CoA-carboxylase] ligase
MSSLDRGRVDQGLDAATRELLTDLEVFDSIDSTNTYLAGVPAPPRGRLRVAIANEQTAGRGRQNRQWVSPRGLGLYQSLAYTVETKRDDISALTLALGVGVLEALATHGISSVRLKWPNDLVAEDAKLGGLLAETRTADDALVVIAGIGINVAMDERTRSLAASGWAQRGIALADISATVPDRNALASAVTNAVAAVFRGFEATGLAGYVERWRAADWLLGQGIRVESTAAVHAGIAAGVDDTGALLVETESGLVPVTAGTVSMLGTGP